MSNCMNTARHSQYACATCGYCSWHCHCKPAPAQPAPTVDGYPLMEGIPPAPDDLFEGEREEWRSAVEARDMVVKVQQAEIERLKSTPTKPEQPQGLGVDAAEWLRQESLEHNPPLGYIGEQARAVRAHIDSLEQRVEALTKQLAEANARGAEDAERYRWVMDVANADHPIWGELIIGSAEAASKDRIDSAIDAARSAASAPAESKP